MAQRTRSQRWYPNADDKAAETASKLDALEVVFEFLALTYHRFWKKESDYDSSYKAPSRSNLEEALRKMENTAA